MCKLLQNPGTGDRPPGRCGCAGGRLLGEFLHKHALVVVVAGVPVRRGQEQLSGVITGSGCAFPMIPSVRAHHPIPPSCHLERTQDLPPRGLTTERGPLI